MTKRQREKLLFFPEEGFKWNGVGRLAQKFYRDYEGYYRYSLLARLKENKQQLRGFD